MGIKTTGDVTSFNNRSGAVLPLSGDYDKSMVGLDQVDNTSDINKPVSTPQQGAINTAVLGSAKILYTEASFAAEKLLGDVVDLGNLPAGARVFDVQIIAERSGVVDEMQPVSVSVDAGTYAVTNEFTKGGAVELTIAPIDARSWYREATAYKVKITFSANTAQLPAHKIRCWVKYTQE